MKKIVTILISFFVLIVMIIGIWQITKSFQTDTTGTIKIELVDLEDTIVLQKTIPFEKGDTLPSLIEENFKNVVFENGMLMQIESFTTPTDWSYFICVYVDHQVSELGISSIVFKNGTVITLKLTPYVPS